MRGSPFSIRALAAFALLGAPALCRAQGVAGTISTVAGSGTLGFSGDGGPATSARLFSPAGLALDNAGNLFLLDQGNHRIRKVNTAGVISTVAGNGSGGFSGDGGPATSASFSSATGHQGISVDRGGNLYLADYSNQRVRKVDSSGIITTVAGNGIRTYSGDGGPATSASLTDPVAVAVDAAGNLYIAEFAGNRVRKVDTAGVITTAAGGGPLGSNGDGGPATKAVLNAPFALALDPAGNLYIADATARRIRKVNTAGIISTVAGNGGNFYSGDGGPATSASFDPTGVAADGAGNVFICETENRVRQVNAAGIISTIAGTGVGGFSGDGGPATSAMLQSPNDVGLDSAGNLYIADSFSMRVRKVTNAAQPTIPAIAANGVVNGASFQPGIVANSWVTVQGFNLAFVTDTWANSIVNGKLPTTLDGVTVTIAGKPAYLYYISPGQINLVAPDTGSGPVQVVVLNSAGVSQAFTVTSSQYGPAFFTWPGNQVVATRQDFSLAVKDGTFAASTVPAKPGDVIILWGTGFGPTTPPAPTGVQLPADQTYSTSTLPAVTINNVPATIFGAALAPGFAGLYQVAIQVPSSLADGDWPLVTSIGGVQSPNGTVLSVHR